MNRHLWSKDETKILVKLFEGGCTIEEMRDVFKDLYSDQAIRSKLKAMNCSLIARESKRKADINEKLYKSLISIRQEEG